MHYVGGSCLKEAITINHVCSDSFPYAAWVNENYYIYKADNVKWIDEPEARFSLVQSMTVNLVYKFWWHLLH